MHIIKDTDFHSFSMPEGAGLWVALGIFDGLHMGHRKVISTCVSEARDSGEVPGVLTFARHPAGVLGGEPVRKSLLTIEERIEGFGGLGTEYIFLPEFTLDFARQAPEDFIQDILIHQLHVSGIVVGFNYRFGRKRTGDVDLLVREGKRLGFEVHPIAPETYQGKPISSTRIREGLREGQLEDVTEMLGRPFEILGEVIGGDRRGRTMGFPTANLSLARPSFLPDGVYAARIRFDEGREYGAMLYIGGRPTFKNDEQDRSVEVHILDFRNDVYGKRLYVEPLERLRGEERFSSMNELRKQILLDIEKAKSILSLSKGHRHE